VLFRREQETAMPPDIASLDLPLERDVFLRQLLRELAGTLEEVVGRDDAAGFISIVGQNIGRWIAPPTARPRVRSGWIASRSPRCWSISSAASRATST
jgi:hypothetical protein